LTVSCHFRGCKAPLFKIVSGAISSELALPLPLGGGAPGGREGGREGGKGGRGEEGGEQEGKGVPECPNPELASLPNNRRQNTVCV